MTISAGNGTVALASTAGSLGQGNGTSEIVAIGSLASLNADLVGLTYSPDPGYFGVDQINFSDVDASDQPPAATAEIQLFVAPVSPTISAPAAVELSQTDSFSFSGGNAISVTDPSATTAAIIEQLTLSASHGTLSLATANGLSVLNNGTYSVTVSGPLESLDGDLSSLVYTPDPGYHGPDLLNVSETDTTNQMSASQSVIINAAPTNSQAAQLAFGREPTGSRPEER